MILFQFIFIIQSLHSRFASPTRTSIRCLNATPARLGSIPTASTPVLRSCPGTTRTGPVKTVKIEVGKLAGRIEVESFTGSSWSTSRQEKVLCKPNQVFELA